MVLVTYSDSDSDGESDIAATSGEHGTITCKIVDQRERKKRKAVEIAQQDGSRSVPPPLPSSLHSLYASDVRRSTSDDPSLHGGRQRQIPHIPGQWPSHIYLEWFPSQDEHASLKELILQAKKQFKPEDETLTETMICPFIESSLGVRLPLHISLSAPLVLNTAEKDDFETQLSKKIRLSGIQAFDTSISALDWVANSDGSRQFLVLRLKKPTNDELNGLLGYCNHVCKEFRLPCLYDQDGSDAFHISIAWTLNKPNLQTRQTVSTIPILDLSRRAIHCTKINVKIGNTITEFALRKQV